MPSIRSLLTLALLTIAGTVASAPSPAKIGADLTILVDDDLSGSKRPAAILLGSSTTLATAKQGCQNLSESLWSPEAQAFNAGLQKSLAYQVYLKNFPVNQLFWVNQGTSYGSCRATNAQGRISTVNCVSKLPALCTQTAPYSSSTSANTSATFQVSQTTGNQTLIGYRDALSWRFLGVRYAPQPKRWTYSTLYEGSGETTALQTSPVCTQNGQPGSEDCLFLNIWTPYLPRDGSKVSRSKAKAVLFWIHGGAFTGGTGADTIFDGGHVAARGDVVVVTVNYRLSTLGFLALNDGVTNGNYGLQDIITALRWVQKNIKQFGGDPSRVTIYGQSAGAAATRALMSSPLAKGLFSAAIPQSNLAGTNYATTYGHWYTIPEEVTAAADPILTATGCSNSTDQLACLRAYDGYKLQTLSTVARYLVVDGDYLVSSELAVTGNNYIASVPVMQGLTRDDGAAFIGFATTTNVSQALTNQYFPADTILASGDFSTPENANQTLAVFNVTARVSTDAQVRCLDQAGSYSAAKHGVLPTQYFYEFNRTYQTVGWSPNAPTCQAPPSAAHPNGDADGEYFKCHSGELYYEFGNIFREGLPDRDGKDILFSQLIVDYWSSFARTYDPNPDPEYLKVRGYTNTIDQVAKSGKWVKVDADNPTLRQLQVNGNQIPFKEKSQCDVLGLPLDYYENEQ